MLSNVVKSLLLMLQFSSALLRCKNYNPRLRGDGDVTDTHETRFSTLLVCSCSAHASQPFSSARGVEGRGERRARARSEGGQLPGAEIGRSSTERKREAEGGRKPAPALDSDINIY